eukprot:4795055-Prymnesium_polylepis.1
MSRSIRQDILFQPVVPVADAGHGFIGGLDDGPQGVLKHRIQIGEHASLEIQDEIPPQVSTCGTARQELPRPGEALHAAAPSRHIRFHRMVIKVLIGELWIEHVPRACRSCKSGRQRRKWRRMRLPEDARNLLRWQASAYKGRQHQCAVLGDRLGPRNIV